MSSTSTITELTGEQAAQMIQRVWRQHADRMLYKKLLHLVNFRNRGDPATLLRVINPVEAKLLDPAVGAHVRFRLGGAKWPPQIYYKIFLHSPVCDVNRFAPRNYVATLNVDPGDITQDKLEEMADKFGWYKRVENNGWRPISTLSPSAIDLITQLTDKAPSRKYTKMKLRKKGQESKAIIMEKVRAYLKNQQPDEEDVLAWAEALNADEDDWDTLGTTGPSSDLWWRQMEEEDEEDDSDSSLDEEELMRLLGQ